MEKTYKCSVCGNVVALNHESNGQLSCCNKNMTLLNTNYDDSATSEKHIPILEKIKENTYEITVGKIEHPMTSEHYIEYIEVITDKKERLTFFLNNNDKPKIIFTTLNKIISVKSYCNLHGVWGKNL